MKKILIVVDMQNDFIDGALGTKEAVGIIDNAVKRIESFNGDIFVTLDTHSDDYSNTREGKYLPVEHCIKNTHGWKLNSKIADSLSKKKYETIEKPTFGSIKLPDIIAEKYDVSDIEIELIGLCTDICVVSNALLLKSSFPEINIIVNSNCCAGVTPEKHSAALETMKSCQIDVI